MEAPKNMRFLFSSKSVTPAKAIAKSIVRSYFLCFSMSFFFEAEDTSIVRVCWISLPCNFSMAELWHFDRSIPYTLSRYSPWSTTRQQLKDKRNKRKILHNGFFFPVLDSSPEAWRCSTTVFWAINKSIRTVCFLTFFSSLIIFLQSMAIAI
jgi:hypothetical protein